MADSITMRYLRCKVTGCNWSSRVLKARDADGRQEREFDRHLVEHDIGKPLVVTYEEAVRSGQREA